VPTLGGANIAVRLLDPMRPRTLADLGFSVKAAARIETFFAHRQGAILVTGPSGSGRVATLYSFLRRLHAPGRRVVTVEEQIAHIDDDFSQAEVDVDSGDTFAPYLRAFLGHHPEVLMVGALNEPEAAGLAFRAVEGGSLVLSTLLTSRAIDAPDGISDLRVPASLVSRSLLGVVAQRIVRKLCASCRQPAAQPPAELGRLFGGTPNFAFYEGAGCDQCHGTGYRGHAIVADVWRVGDEDRAAIAAAAPIRAHAATSDGQYSMVEDAHDRLAAGWTTVEELLRALPASAIAEFKARYS
jgi:type IV pilus assembly protein PilB